MTGNIESEGYGAMANNMICMFGISLFKHTGYCDVMEDGIQYKVAEWDLCDMKKYNGKYAVVGFDGSLRIYEETGEELFRWYSICFPSAISRSVLIIFTAYSLKFTRCT